jgi:hypothetical protein
MKKSFKHIIMTVSAGIVCFNLYAQSVTVADSSKNPVTVDLSKHPEVIAKVRENIFNGKLAYYKTKERTDTTLDLSKHPELVKAIIANPANWPIILKAHNNSNDSLSMEGKNKQVIRDILAYLIQNNLIKERGDVSSFMLTSDAFSLNGKKLPEKFHASLKEKYIKTPDFVVYYGNSEMKGNGIFQRAGNL